MKRLPALILIFSLIFTLFPVPEAKATTLSGGTFLCHFDNTTRNVRDGDSGTSSGISYSSGKFSNGITFNSTDYLYYSAGGNINRTLGTLEFWYSPSYSWSSSATTAILFMYDVNTQAKSYFSYLGVWGYSIAGNKTKLAAEIAVESAGVTQTLTSSASTTWTSGSSHHIAVTWDSSAFKLYVDGSLEDSINSPTLLDIDRSTIFVGNDMFADEWSALGTIDELVILDSVRSASQISSDYQETSAFTIEEAAATTTTTTTTTEGGADTTPPTISEVAASKVTKTSALITWTTNEPSSSIIDYGTTSSYGSNIRQDEETKVTSHAVTLSGLQSGTTYHYRIESVDPAGIPGFSSNKTFKTVEIDVLPPKISFGETKQIYTTSKIIISGTASDNLSGVASLSYTLDGYKFFPLEGKNQFTIQLDLEDDSYRLQVKGIDNEGNIGFSEALRFVVDTIPPSLGAHTFFLGPQKLFPDETGALSVSSGATLNMVTSAVGGATMVQAETNGDTYSLQRIPGTSLWRGTISFNQEGMFDLEVTSEDGAGNVVTQKLNPINVLSEGVVRTPSGDPVEGASVIVYIQTEETSLFPTRWQVWEAEIYDQQNPQTTDSEGKFHYFLPQGIYQLEIEKRGFRTFVSEPLTIETPTPLSTIITLDPKLQIKIFGNEYVIPWYLDLLAKRKEIPLELPTITQETPARIEIGKLAPNFYLSSTIGGGLELQRLRGRRILLSFWTTWDPSSSEQIAIIDKIKIPTGEVGIFPVAVMESRERATSFLERGGYLLTSLVDEKGEILEDYPLSTIPQHVLIGEDGRIKKVATGILSEEEMLDFVEL